MLAKTAAAGSTGLHPDVLAMSTSLDHDLHMVREDLCGSMAHLTMLARTKLIPAEAAAALKGGLKELAREALAGTLQLPREEDVHMAVEAELGKRVGAASGFLHTARSRNDQVATDLRLHVRERCAEAVEALLQLITALCDRAEAEQDTLMPSYTHRQRAQPISAAYWLLGTAAQLQRDVEGFRFAHQGASALPLGVGAIAGSSLPIDRELSRALLKFDRLTLNGLDTVGDRDFMLDYLYAASRLLLHASRFGTDVIDYSSREFGFLELDGEIACGSSMMPQKKNPDVFELVRGKSGPQVGDLVSLLVTVKGLPGGYNRDLQEDRRPLLDTGARVRTVTSTLQLALPRIHFNVERCFAALKADATQATDLAEALVSRGMPFREAYKKVGALVRAAQEHSVPLNDLAPSLARETDACFTDEVMASAKVAGSVARKSTFGSTGPSSIKAQLELLRAFVTRTRAEWASAPRLETLLAELMETPL